ncbi:MAG: hypothetical protein KME35_22795 [Aphanocapsa sp. GSE-SYN-MK-11-07L]|jgi:hypothetical protein|nr:hypothetical protein [Aphanocapsa sp. GSE-SYN-MK-11-07L]
MQPYPSVVEQQMQRLYQSLNERDRRRYAAVEASKLGHGGMSYICGLFECNYRSLALGLEELQQASVMQQDSSKCLTMIGHR